MIVWQIFIFPILLSSSEPLTGAVYSNIESANTTESYLKIKNMPLVNYKFLYDSVPDRLHMGIIGPNAQNFFPESIDVIPHHTIPNKDKSKPPITLDNFPIVDKNVIFMHGIAALQHLLSKYDEVQQTMDSYTNDRAELFNQFQEVKSLLNKEADDILLEQLEIAKLEADLAKNELLLSESKLEAESRLMLASLEEEKKLMEFEESLARERLMKQDELLRESAAETLKMEKELAMERDKLHRESVESLRKIKQQQDSELDTKRLEFEKERIRTELQGKADQERLQAEIALRKLQVQAQLDTDRFIQSIKTISNQISIMIHDLFSNPKQLLLITSGILLLIASFYFIKEFASMIRQSIQSYIGRPSLIRETSRSYDNYSLFSFSFQKKLEETSITLQKLREDFEDIILSEDDKERVVTLTLATKNTKLTKAPYRHILLHGHPGTGKTLIARRIAKCSGMDYAIMSGGDVAPLGAEAVNQLHDLFRWAKKSRKGLLLFIDEAEAFLGSRGNEMGGSVSDIGDVHHLRNALNALLYQTGTPSNSFMLVLATNRPEDLDPAILDRVDVTLHIALPGEKQRSNLIKYYYNLHVIQIADESQKLIEKINKSWIKFMLSKKDVQKIDEECTKEDVLIRMSKQTNGFSGREIAKLFISIQYAMYLAKNQTLTMKILMDTLDSKVKDHHFKSIITSKWDGDLSEIPSVNKILDPKDDMKTVDIIEKIKEKE